MASNIVFRVDASDAIGAGHLSRCMALAYGLKQRGLVCHFVVASEFCLELIAGHYLAEKTLCVTPGDEQDGQYVKGVVDRLKPVAVVLDGYHFDEPYRRALSEQATLLLFDDLNNSGCLHADLIINAYVKAAELNYTTTAGQAELLLGNQYAVMPKNLIDNKPRALKDRNHLLVCFGASDVKAYTLPVLKQLVDQLRKEEKDLPVDVICGGLVKQSAAIEAYCEAHGFNYIYNCKDMSPYFQHARVAIAAPGSMLYELAYFQIPSIFLLAAENQMLNAQHHESLGWCQLEKTEYKAVMSALTLYNNEKQCQSNADICQHLVDGNAADRISLALIKNIRGQTISGFNIQLKPMKKEHLEQVRAWRNHPQVADFMLTGDEISSLQQQQWFENIKDDISQQHYLIYYREQAIGVINATVVEGGSLVNADAIEVGMYLAPDCKYRGTILAFCPALAMNKQCFESWGCKELRAVVVKGNDKAIRFNQQLGYQIKSEQHDVTTMTMSENNFNHAVKQFKQVIR